MSQEHQAVAQKQLREIRLEREINELCGGRDDERIPMLCAHCGSTRLWPDDFPSRIHAQCTDCVAHERVIRSPFARFATWVRSFFS